MSEHGQFVARAAVKSEDEQHRRKLLKVIGTYHHSVSAMKRTQFLDWETARERAAAIKRAAISRLPTLLEEFEAKISARGAKVLWAESVSEAQRLVIEIFERYQAKKVVKSKSMITEELGLNELLEGHGVEVWETDLGELIVQLAGEKPYHIVTPAMHKSKEEVSELFHRKLGIARTENAEELTMAARRHLREAYLNADIGISGANFLIADQGAIVITENEGNARLSVSCPPVHIAIAGIEKVLPRLADLEFFLPLLATSGTGQRLTVYNSILRGPRQEAEPDGPREMYVILIDNGRSGIYADREMRESLHCIRCGACLNACPVYKGIGGHSYNTPYQGPIGSVITPHLRGFREWYHLPYASSLCGACTEVCPVGIPLHHLLLANRERAVMNRAVGWFWPVIIGAWGAVYSREWLLRIVRPLSRCGTRVLRPLLSVLGISIPELPRCSFSTRWRGSRR